MRSLHTVEDADAFEREVAVGQQGLADVVPGELLLFQHHYAAAFGSQHSGGRGAGRSPSNYDRIIGIAGLHGVMR